jgi:hypothetical protein
LKNKQFIYKYQFLFFIYISVFFISCNKNEEIGTNIQPDENQIGVFYTYNIPITAHTIMEDSVRTDETILNMIGSYKDDIFGTTTTGMYTQFRLTTSAVSFGTNPICDSVVLSLAYNGGFYGDTSSQTQLTLSVYEIAENFNLDDVYYSNQRLATFKNNLVNYTFKPNLKDSVKVGNNILPPQLRVKLKKELGDKIVSAATSNLADNESFIKFFRGLYITTNKVSTSGAILYINSLSSYSKITLYYHNDTDTLTYNLVLNDKCARFNSFDHYKYSGAVVTFIKQIINNDTILGDDKLYLQAMAGTKIRLKFPKVIDSSYFGNTPLNNIAINKAELIIEVDQTTIADMAPPSLLSVVVINKDGTYSFLPDVAYGEAYFGGNYNSTTHEYHFNISKYIQNSVQNGSFNDNGLFIVVSGSAVKGNRAIINGPKSSEDFMRLEIIYTKIK